MKQISLEELKSWQDSKTDFELIDVRESWEHELFNIGGKLIPLGEIMSRKDEIEISDKPVVVYCKRGIRSQIAIQRLEAYFKNIDFYNLDRGVYDLM